jgi:hypothetical protein
MQNSSMPLRRASCQPSASLETFYGKMAASSDNVSIGVGKKMLSLLPLLSEKFADLNVWGLTSLAHLWLLAADDYKSPWLVSVTALTGTGYKIRYRMAEADAPWAKAFVEGTAKDEAEACELILIAMRRSGGWRNDQLAE